MTSATASTHAATVSAVREAGRQETDELACEGPGVPAPSDAGTGALIGSAGLALSLGLSVHHMRVHEQADALQAAIEGPKREVGKASRATDGGEETGGGADVGGQSEDDDDNQRPESKLDHQALVPVRGSGSQLTVSEDQGLPAP